MDNENQLIHARKENLDACSKWVQIHSPQKQNALII